MGLVVGEVSCGASTGYHLCYEMFVFEKEQSEGSGLELFSHRHYVQKWKNPPLSFRLCLQMGLP